MWCFCASKISLTSGLVASGKIHLAVKIAKLNSALVSWSLKLMLGLTGRPRCKSFAKSSLVGTQQMRTSLLILVQYPFDRLEGLWRRSCWDLYHQPGSPRMALLVAGLGVRRLLSEWWHPVQNWKQEPQWSTRKRATNRQSSWMRTWQRMPNDW